MPEEEMAKLLQQLQKQLLLYREIHAAAQALGQLCETAAFDREEELKELNLLLLKRKDLMEQVEKSQQEAKNIKTRLAEKLKLPAIDSKELTGLIPGPASFCLQEALEQMGLLLKEIAKLDSQAQASLKAKLNIAGEEIEKLQKLKKLSLAYSPSEKQIEGFFVDGQR